MFRQHVRHRLADELKRWAESGQLFGGLGMGPTIMAPRYDGISFGRNNSTVGGMGGFGGLNPADRIERGIELLSLCSTMPRDQRPLEEIELLATLTRTIATRALESNSEEGIDWSNVYTVDNNFLGVYVSFGRTGWIGANSPNQKLRADCFDGSNSYKLVKWLVLMM